MFKFNKNHYNLIFCSYSYDCWDQDKQILHSCFNILNDYVNCSGGIDDYEIFTSDLLYNPDKNAPELCLKQGERQKQIIELYYWWNYDRPLKKYKLKFLKNKEYWKLEDEIYKDEQRNLKKLINIRSSLWI